MLFKNGFGYVWVEQSVGDIKGYIRCLKKDLSTNIDRIGHPTSVLRIGINFTVHSKKPG